MSDPGYVRSAYIGDRHHVETREAREIAELRKSFVWIPVERLPWHRETRPSRLLGPAVSPLTTHERGCCMACGRRLEEPVCDASWGFIYVPPGANLSQRFIDAYVAGRQNRHNRRRAGLDVVVKA